MKYIVPSSRIVFTDFMILLVSILIGLNSIMSFSEERNLPPVSLPGIDDTGNVGVTDVKKAWITIRSGESGKTYFYNEREVSLWDLMAFIKSSRIPTVVLRGDRAMAFTWEEFSRLTSQLMKAGVREISYAFTVTGGKRP